MKKRLIIFLFFLLRLKLSATHIVGGEMIYDHLGGDKYRITLKIYRDCSTTVPFDGTSEGNLQTYISVFDVSGNLEGLYDIGAPVINPVPPAFNNPCIITPNTVCVEEGVYTYTLTLPSKAGGYTVVYQRCCRNANILNLVHSQQEGSTYYTKIPGPEEAAVNSSPRFKKFPPIYICKDVSFKFDHSALDPDGDQLVYSLCAPFTGLDGCCPSLGLSGTPATSSSCPNPPASCPQIASLPPYNNVLFLAPYSGTYPIPSNPAFAINPISGELSGTPTMVAQYVVGVCVKEYRNNVLINTHFRDFQFTVLGCTVTVLSVVADQTTQCQGKTISFQNQSINQSTTPYYHWDFGIPNMSSDTSNLFNASFNYPDTGTYILSLITNPGKPCTDTLKKPVYVYPPLDVTFPHPERQCLKNNSFQFTATGTLVAQTTFTWDFSENATPSSSNLKAVSSVSFNQGGLFLVKLQAKQFACLDSCIDTIRVIKRPIAKINNLPGKLCEPALIGFSNGSSSELPLKYYWTFSNGNSSTDYEPKQLFASAGNYEVTLVVETESICKDTSNFKISPVIVYPSPKAGFSISPKETSIFEPEIKIKSPWSSESSNFSYFTFGDGGSSTEAQPAYSYQEYGTFTITQIITNTFGCKDTSRETVVILPEFRFWIPNSFSPDNNSLNDVFMPVTFGIRKYTFEIYSRWGELIFRTRDPEEGWNGSYKNAESPQGIYVWEIEYTNVVTNKVEHRVGHLMLLRSP